MRGKYGPITILLAVALGVFLLGAQLGWWVETPPVEERIQRVFISATQTASVAP